MATVLLLSRQPLAKRPLQHWLDDTAERVVLLTTPKAVAGSEDVLAEFFPRHVLVPDYGGWSTEEAAERAAREHRVDLVASTSESDVLRAARLRERLGLPGQDTASATAYRDKVVMKRLMAGSPVALPAFAAVDHPQDLLAFVEEHGFPVVVKPRFGAGAEGVSILRGPADVTAFFEGQRGAEVPYLPGQWMAETFVRGDFFHVDGIMRDGRVVHAWPARYSGGLAERVRDDAFVSSVLLAPDDERLPLLRKLADQVIGTLPPAPHPLAFHLEGWIGADGVPVLCEIASRAGGGLIAEAYERAFGVQLAREGLRAQCGSALALDHQPTAPAATEGWIFLPFGHGAFSPPAGRCPVPGSEVVSMLEAGAIGEGVRAVTDAAARVFVRAGTVEEVHKRLAEVADWWQANAGWR